MLDDNIEAIGRDKLINLETTKMHRSEKLQIKKTIDINCNNAGDIGQVKSKEEQRKELEVELQSFKFLDAENDKSILEEGKKILLITLITDSLNSLETNKSTQALNLQQTKKFNSNFL